MKSGWLAICSDTTREQLGKDMNWHNITTCASITFALEATTIVKSDNCPSFSECINVYCSGVDMDFITLRVIVIAYINSVGLLLLSTIVSMSGWLLVWILLSTRGASASGIPVTNSATKLACGVLGRAGGSSRCMGFCAIPTCMLVLGF